MANEHNVVELGSDWTYLVAISGEAGRQWVEEFSQGEPARMENCLKQSRSLLYNRRLQEGSDLLLRVEASLPALPASPVTSVIYHRFLAVLAYSHYCHEDFDAAERLLAEAHQEVQQVIEQNPFLISLANRCYDFCQQQIRISRGRLRWEEMAKRIETVRQILRDQIPLCILSSGTPVHFATIVNFYDCLPDLTERELSIIRSVFDQETRRYYFENLVRHLYAPPGFVIPYP